MKRVYLVHGWGGSSEDNWFPWLKKELEERGAEVYSLDMPDTSHPKIEEWVKELEYRIDEADRQTYFIGHSIGCQTILRYMEKLHRDRKIGGCLFVAPWFNLINLNPEEMEIAHPWINTRADFGRIIEHCTKFVSLFSEDDPDVPLSDSEIFRRKLGSEIIVEKGKGHFTEREEPEILREALKMLRLK